MFLKLNAKIYTEIDGKHVGTLQFVVLDPKTKKLDSIENEGLILTEKVTFPAHWITDISDSAISLSHTREDISQRAFVS